MHDSSTESYPHDRRGDDANYLLVIADGSSRRFAMPTSGRALVGRMQEAELHFDDDSISRRHAMITGRGGALAIADLGSHNGTKVNGERVVGLCELAPGDVVQVGDVVLVACGRAAAKVPDVFMGRRLTAQLDVELERAAAYDRELAVLVVRGDGVASAAELARVLAGELRPIDLIGEIGGRAVAIVPELDSIAALDLARRCAARLGTSARVGLARCPAHGADASALLAAARDAADASAPGFAADAEVTITRLDVGGRATVIADAAMLRLTELVRRIAGTNLAVLVCGETGSGKEHIARAVHTLGARAKGPFVALNCAAVQDALVESELFGYERGAFTGAATAKLGLLEAAAGGTVFLDEVGELSSGMQAKLLRALDEKRITRVGSVVERDIDIRVVAATHRDLEADAASGRFRRDLYFRLAGATVALPPLRDRPRELACLAQTFAAEACARAGRAQLRMTAGAMRALALHTWPGNVRELRHAIEYAVAIAGDGDALAAWHVPARQFADPAPSASFRPLADEVRELEHRRMREAIAAAEGVLKRAASLLRMPLRTFHTKAKDYGLVVKRVLPPAD